MYSKIRDRIKLSLESQTRLQVFFIITVMIITTYPLLDIKYEFYYILLFLSYSIFSKNLAIIDLHFSCTVGVSIVYLQPPTSYPFSRKLIATGPPTVLPMESVLLFIPFQVQTIGTRHCYAISEEMHHSVAAPAAAIVQALLGR
jgi:hypothetical protein